MTYEPLESKVWREAFNAAVASCTGDISSDRAVAHATKVADRALTVWLDRFGAAIDEQTKGRIP